MGQRGEERWGGQGRAERGREVGRAGGGRRGEGFTIPSHYSVPPSCKFHLVGSGIVGVVPTTSSIRMYIYTHTYIRTRTRTHARTRTHTHNKIH